MKLLFFNPKKNVTNIVTEPVTTIVTPLITTFFLTQSGIITGGCNNSIAITVGIIGLKINYLRKLNCYSLLHPINLSPLTPIFFRKQDLQLIGY